jgi:hypothetical protein
MSRHGVDFRLATIVLLLLGGAVAVAALAAEVGPGSLALPAAGLLFGGLCLAWEEAQGIKDRHR